jgi:energy-coupling factor transport system ATP-binding protein
MISVNQVTFKYQNNEVPALNNLSLTIPNGDFLGIIGTSGAGKTTLALSMAGIIPHEFPGDFYGSILVDGEDTVDCPVGHFCQKIGLVFQDIDSQMVASVVEDEILFGLENFGTPKNEIEYRMNKVLKELGIENLKNREISTLSGGQKQKVAIASILALEPEIIILDEPTGELDPESTQEIFTLLKKLNDEKGITIVIIEQKIKLLCEYVKHLVVLDKGVLQFDGEPRKVITNVAAFKDLGINVPPVAELSAKLRENELYTGDITLNVEEAETMVRKVLGI